MRPAAASVSTFLWMPPPTPWLAAWPPCRGVGVGRGSCRVSLGRKVGVCRSPVSQASPVGPHGPSGLFGASLAAPRPVPPWAFSIRAEQEGRGGGSVGEFRRQDGMPGNPGTQPHPESSLGAACRGGSRSDKVAAGLPKGPDGGPHGGGRVTEIHLQLPVSLACS